MLGDEVEAHTANRSAAVAHLRCRLAQPDHADVFALNREILGHDRDAAGRQRGNELALRANDAVERLDELEVNRPDIGDDTDLGPSDLAELGDLAKSPHRELENADLAVGLQTAQRQRDADLVVEAPLVGDRTRRRCAKSGEQVLGRGLAHRARDPDHPC